MAEAFIGSVGNVNELTTLESVQAEIRKARQEGTSKYAMKDLLERKKQLEAELTQDKPSEA